MQRNLRLAVRTAFIAVMDTPAAIATATVNIRKQPDAPATFFLMGGGGKQKAQWKTERKIKGGA